MPPRVSLSERQVTVRRFMDILGITNLENAGINLHHQQGNRYIKWHSLPDQLWDRGQYICLPREVIFETPTQTVEERRSILLRSPWTEEVADIMKDALDKNLVKILPRRGDRPIVFEVFDKDGETTDVGPFQKRKRRTTSLERPESSSSGSSDDESADDPEDINDGSDKMMDTDSTSEANPMARKFRKISRVLKRLYRNNGLEKSGQVIEWTKLPEILARKRVILSGLPEACAPRIVDDTILPTSSPGHWTIEQCDAFLSAERSGKLKLVSRDHYGPFLYRLQKPSGELVNSTLQYSQSWLRKHMSTKPNNLELPQRSRRNPRDAEMEKRSKVPPNATVKDSGRGWVVVEESTDEEDSNTEASKDKEQRKQLRVQVSSAVLNAIIDFNIRGDGSEVSWNQLPLALAQCNKYISGMPFKSLPKIKDDKVIFQASHPSLWSGEVILRMKEAMDAETFKLVDRPPGRIVLFEVEDDTGRMYDSTLGFSSDWIAINIPDKTLESKKAEVLNRLQQKLDRNVTVAVNRKAEETEKRKSRNSAPDESRRGSQRNKKAEENSKTKAESDRARAKAEAIARERFGGWFYGVSNVPAFRAPAGSVFSKPSHTSPSPAVPIWSTYRDAALTAPKSKAVLHPRQGLKEKQKKNSMAESSPTETFPPQSPGASSSRSLDSSNVESTTRHSATLETRNSEVSTSHSNMRWPPPGFPAPIWDDSHFKLFHHALGKFFERYALASAKIPVPWLNLPKLLSERKQYLRGIPFICLPTVKDDQVEEGSLLENWSSEMSAAMYWALNENLLMVKNREPGRRVLFEVISPDGECFDSTLGFSKGWLDKHLPDTTTPQQANLPLPAESYNAKRQRSNTVDSLQKGAGREFKRRKGYENGQQGHNNASIRDAEPKNRSPTHSTFQFNPSSNHDVVMEDSMDPRTLGIERLIPNSLPAVLHKGRVFLRIGRSRSVEGESSSKSDDNEEWEWIPPEGYSMPTGKSTIWNPTQAKWRFVGVQRSFEHLGHIKGGQTIEWPNTVDGNILGRGECLYNDQRQKWEMVFKSNPSPNWVILWDPVVARWEWSLLT